MRFLGRFCPSAGGLLCVLVAITRQLSGLSNFGSSSSSSTNGVILEDTSSNPLPSYPISSSSQMESTEWLDLMFPLRNVCFSQSATNKTKIHFFQSGNEPDSATETRNYFKANRNPAEIYHGYRKKRYQFDPQTVLHPQTSMVDYIESAKQKVQFYNGTSFVLPIHMPHNMFHLFNDLILPLAQLKWKSQATSPTNIFLLEGNPEFWERRAVMANILPNLLDKMHYPFEELLAQQGSMVCFERFIWAQKMDDLNRQTWRPYYRHTGRFDEPHNNQWKGVVPLVRDTINSAYNITSKQKSQGATLTTDATPTDKLSALLGKPTLAWAGRSAEGKTCTRCIVNEVSLITALQKKFYVKMLPISGVLGGKILSPKEKLEITLRHMASADILGGLHGAGLGHAVLLQPNTMLLEIRDHYKPYTRLYMNVANLQEDVGYYVYDARPFVIGPTEKGRYEKGRYQITAQAMEQLTNDLFQAWEQEQANRAMKKNLDGKCHFPSIDTLNGRVSSFNVSHCFLVQNDTTGQWETLNRDP